jgi:hypothetical protein
MKTRKNQRGASLLAPAARANGVKICSCVDSIVKAANRRGCRHRWRGALITTRLGGARRRRCAQQRSA